jgi:ribosome biogenesis GTPase
LRGGYAFTRLREHTVIMIDIDFASLRHIGLTQTIISQLHTLDNTTPGTQLMRVTEVHRDAFTLHDGVHEHRARLLRDTSLATGDWVLTEPGGPGELWIAHRLDPVTQIARRTNDGRRQTLASNVDTALLVMGLDLDFNLRRMERYISLVQTAGVAAVAVLTKRDIGDDVDERMAQLRDRLPASVPAIAVNALDPQAAEALSPWLGEGQTLILLGSSGAGKSTLTNALAASSQETGGVRLGDGRGRHTTTTRSLHRCPGGACIIDTPGLRTWRADADEDALAASFEDIDALARACQFRDCQHQGEPGCAVQGAVDADRLQNYHKLLREARRGQQTPLDRIAERARWKVVAKAGEARGRQKRGLG